MSHRRLLICNWLVNVACLPYTSEATQAQSPPTLVRVWTPPRESFSSLKTLSVFFIILLVVYHNLQPVPLSKISLATKFPLI